jgi:ATP synthase protein I
MARKLIDTDVATVLFSLGFLPRGMRMERTTDMDEEKKSLLKTLGMVSTMGISMAVAIVIGVFIGNYLDKWLGTKHWFFFIFLFFGIVAGFRNLYIIAGKELKDDGEGKDKRG